jgi:hypothetical protein
LVRFYDIDLKDNEEIFEEQKIKKENDKEQQRNGG